MTTLSTPLPYSAPETALPVLESGRVLPYRLGKIALNLFVVVACLFSALFVSFHALAAYLLSHPPVVSIGSNPMLAKNLTYSEVVFPSADEDMELNGWWIPASVAASASAAVAIASSESEASRKTVVLSHGYGTNREEPWVPMYDLAELLHGMAYNVLMFDYGFAGQNPSQPATGGVSESRQLIGAIRYARSMGSDEVVVWGFSMGAGTALQAALQSEKVDAMILDSTFLPDEETVYANIRNYAHLPKYPTVSLIRWFFPLMSGTDLDRVPSAEAQTTDYPFPIFLVHGTADDKAPTSIAENVARAQTNELSRLWVVPDAIHEMIYRTHTDEYVSRATAFLDSVHRRTALALLESSVASERTDG